MIERFHHQLKDTLKAHQAAEQWTKHLPHVLIDIRTTPKGNDDDVWTPAELTYGQPLKLSADFQQPKFPICSITSFGHDLQRSMVQLKHPSTAKAPSSRVTYMPAALGETEKVHVEIDRQTNPLKCPYAGPYTVMKRAPKYFTTAINGKQDTVSIDR